jgi:hypothetical protein
LITWNEDYFSSGPPHPNFLPLPFYPAGMTRAMDGTTQALHEYYGLIAYRLFGWI